MARASLEELRLDYEDFLRHRGLPLWPEDDPRRKALVARRCTTAEQVAAWIREQHEIHPESRSIPPIPSIQSTYPELAANAALILLGVTCALLDRQIDSQAAAFTDQGGFTERLYRIRNERRRGALPATRAGGNEQWTQDRNQSRELSRSNSRSSNNEGNAANM